MKTTAKLSLKSLVLLAAFVVTSSEAAQITEKIAAGAELDLVTAYHFRGFIYDKNPAIQPVVWAGTEALNVALWMDFQLAGPNSGLYEVDLTFSGRHHFSRMDLEYGLNNLKADYPGSKVESELMLGLIGTGRSLNPFTRHYFDIRSEFNAYYAEVGAEWTGDVFGWRGELETGLSYSTEEFKQIVGVISGGKSGMHTISLKGSVTPPSKGRISFRPHTTIDIYLNEEMKKAADTSVLVMVGVAIAWF